MWKPGRDRASSSGGDLPLRVLVVEDDTTIAEPLTEGLEHEDSRCVA